jgi:hypothetical protein
MQASVNKAIMVLSKDITYNKVRKEALNHQSP